MRSIIPANIVNGSIIEEITIVFTYMEKYDFCFLTFTFGLENKQIYLQENS